jgi:hypothetical protein
MTGQAQPSRRLILHIGGPKTGSTALQRTLFANREALRARGVDYAEVNLRGFGHHDLAYLLGGGYPAFATPQPRTLGELLDELDEALGGPAPTVVISSENFALHPNPGPLAAAAARAGRQVEVVVYVRRQDELVLSWYNQSVKAQGFAGPLADPSSSVHEQWDVAAVLAPWEAAFGAVTLRVYEKGQLVDDDICADFFQTAQLPAEGLPREADPSNTRLSRDLLEMQRITNRLPLTVQEKRKYHHALMALSRSPEVAPTLNDTPLWTGAQRRALLARFADSNARVAQRYFQRDDLFLQPPPALDTDPAPYPGLRAEVVALVMGWLLAKG